MFRSKKSRSAATGESETNAATSNASPTSNMPNQSPQNASTQAATSNIRNQSPLNASAEATTSNVNNSNEENDDSRVGGSSKRRGKRKRCAVSEESRDWTDEVTFNEREDVRAIDDEGNVEIWHDSIQPHDVWFLKEGVRFEVCFNRYQQPIRKGGSVLVKFVADIARKDEICPISVINWRKVSEGVQTNIVEVIRGKFKIPDGKTYNDAMLRHVGKHRRQWRFELKAIYFKPTMKTREQIDNDKPGGISKANWKDLVKYWYSSKSEKFSKNGKEARASLGHLHTNGSTSFANTRDEFEAKHGREPGGFEFFLQTYKPKDGVYPNNINTEEFINMAKSKIEETTANSSNKPRVEIENEVFDELMYDKDKVNQKPIGYGFGVKRNDVMGVHALLQKRGISSNHTNENQDLQAEFARHKKQTANLVMRMATQMSDLLTAMESGRVSPEMLAAANSALRSITNQSNAEPTNERSENRDMLDESDDE